MMIRPAILALGLATILGVASVHPALAKSKTNLARVAITVTIPKGSFDLSCAIVPLQIDEGPNPAPASYVFAAGPSPCRTTLDLTPGTATFRAMLRTASDTTTRPPTRIILEADPVTKKLSAGRKYRVTVNYKFSPLSGRF